MRSIAIALLLILVPGALCGIPNVGVYCTDNPGQMHYSPTLGESFVCYFFVNELCCYITAIEYKMELPVGIVIQQITYLPEPTTTISLGSPTSGHSVVFWWPVSSCLPGYTLLFTITFSAWKECWDAGGEMSDEPIVVTGHPDTGSVVVTCWPDNEVIPIIGLTSTICPRIIAVEKESWGAIKSMYK